MCAQRDALAEVPDTKEKARVFVLQLHETLSFLAERARVSGSDDLDVLSDIMGHFKNDWSLHEVLAEHSTSLEAAGQCAMRLLHQEHRKVMEQIICAPAAAMGSAERKRKFAIR